MLKLACSRRSDSGYGAKKSEEEKQRGGRGKERWSGSKEIGLPFFPSALHFAPPSTV